MAVNPNGTTGFLPLTPPHVRVSKHITYVLTDGSVYYALTAHHGKTFKTLLKAITECQKAARLKIEHA